jgi:hypothetical protein
VTTARPVFTAVALARAARARAGCRRSWRLRDHGRTSGRVVPEARADEIRRVEQVPPVHDQRVRHHLAEVGKLQPTELRPFRADHERVGPRGGLVDVVREFELGQLFLRSTGRSRITTDHVCTGSQEQPSE